MDRYKVASVIAALALLAAGCTADEVEPREAAYPESIGVTPPGERAASQSPDAVAGREQHGLPPDPAAYPPSVPPAEVVIGDGTEVDPPEPTATAPTGEPAAVDAPGEPPPGGPPSGPPGEPPPGAAASEPGYGDADPSALTDFRPTLDPYGTWTDDPTYGTVWVPSPDVVGDDFTPYASAGHWAYDDDYVWVSDYDWGWVPFHYGRWAYGSGVGWEWIPGRRYAGAWVSWRSGERGYGYVGWAPLAPSWGWRGGVAVGLRNVARTPYSFVNTRNLFSPALRQQLVVGGPAQQIGVRTRPWGSSPGGETRMTGGPPPAVLNIASSSIVHTTVGDRGIVQARAFARPGSAVALGGRAPQGASAPAWQYGGGGAWRPSTTLGASGVDHPGYSSHFGGRLGVGFVGSPNGAGPIRAPATLQGRPYYGSAREGWSPYGNPSRGPGSSPAYRGPVYRAPAYRAPVGAGVGSAFHSGSYGSGGSHVGGGRSGGGGRGGGRR